VPGSNARRASLWKANAENFRKTPIFPMYVRGSTYSTRPDFNSRLREDGWRESSRPEPLAA
jgi:hypothetical protein